MRIKRQNTKKVFYAINRLYAVVNVRIWKRMQEEAYFDTSDAIWNLVENRIRENTRRAIISK